MTKFQDILHSKLLAAEPVPQRRAELEARARRHSYFQAAKEQIELATADTSPFPILDRLLSDCLAAPPQTGSFETAFLQEGVQGAQDAADSQSARDY